MHLKAPISTFFMSHESQTSHIYHPNMSDLLLPLGCGKTM